MGKRIFQIVFIILVVAAFGKAINDYLSKMVSDPSDYEFFIDEYPQGTISRISTLKFSFAKDFDLIDFPINKPVNNDIIHFAPSVKGVLYWTDKRTIEFWPSEPLPEGEQFYYRINIDKIFKETQNKKVFRNTFNTPEIEYQVTSSGLDYYNDSTFTAHGNISFTDFVDFKTIHENVIVKQNSKQLPIHFSPTDLPLRFNYTIDSIIRTEKTDTLNILWKKSRNDIDFRVSSVTIPKLGEFSLLKEQLSYEPNPVITLFFSDIIENRPAGDSIKYISILGSEKHKISTTTNKLIVTLKDSIYPESVGIRLSKDFRSEKNSVLAKPLYRKLLINDQYPDIKNSYDSEIANISSNIISFPLVAKNIEGVDICIYEIMPHNVLQYLQGPEYKDTRELERVGKKVMSEKVNLSEISNYNPDILQTYNLNFQNIAINRNSAYHFIVKYEKEHIKSTLHDSVLPVSDSLSQLCIYTNIDAVVKKLPSDSLSVFVFNKQTGKAVRNADIKLYDFQQHELTTGQTDRFGNLNIQVKRNAIFLKVNYLDNNLFMKIGDYNEIPELSYLNPFFFSGNSDLVVNDSIDFFFFFNNGNTKSWSDTPFKYEFIAPTGKVLYSTIIPVNYSDINRIKHKIYSNTVEGKYTLKLKEGDKIWCKEICITDKGYAKDSICYIPTSDPVKHLIKKKAGDTLHIKYKVPDECYAYVSLDNNSSVIDEQWVTEKGDFLYSRLITSDMWPSLNWSVIIINKKGKQSIITKRIDVIAPDKKLTPKIIAPFDLESGKILSMRVEELDKKPMLYMIRLSLNDSLSSIQNPFTFYSENYRNHISTYSPVNYNLQKDKTEFDFLNPAAKNNIVWGPYNLEESGINSHSLKIPDVISNAYIEIIAANPDKRLYGYASKKVWINTPVMINADMPSQIQPDELIRINAEAIVTKPDTGNITIEINDPVNCTLLEPSRYKLNQDSITSKHNFYINIKSKPLTENASVTVHVSGDDFNFSKTINIAVKSQNPQTISNSIKLLDPDTKWQTRVIPDGFKGNNECFIEFSAGEQIPVDFYLTKMNQIDYYDILSKIATTLPFLYHNEIYGENVKLKDSIDLIIQKTIEELFMFQTPDGNFTNSIYSVKQNEEFNCFAGYFLIESSRKGYEINNRKYNNWIRNLELNILFSDYDFSVIEDNLLAHKLYLSSLVDNLNTVVLNSISDNKKVSTSSKLYLTLALIESGKTKAAKALYEYTKNNTTKYTFADNSLRLHITQKLKYNTENEEIRELILDELESNKSISVKDVGMSLFLMEKAVLKLRQPHRFNVLYRINKGKEVGVISNSLYSIKELPFDYTLPKSIDIANAGKHPVQTSITLSSVTRKPKTIFMRDGIKLETIYTDSIRKETEINNLKTGDELYCTIKLSNNSSTDFKNLLLIYPVLTGWQVQPDNNKNYIIEDNNLLYKVTLKANENININIPFKAVYSGIFQLSPCRLIDLNTGNTLIQLPVKRVSIE